MKKFVLILAAIFLVFSGFAQKLPKFTEEDAKQFYLTMQGDYVIQVNDSTTAMIHFTPIWEKMDRYKWMYLEATISDNVILQKVLEVRPLTSRNFFVFLYDLWDPKQFAGKWANPNYFDGSTVNILKKGRRMTFVKTSDFSYQTNKGPARYNAIDCFPSGDLLHFKFVQEDERFYIKRVPKGTERILGYEGLKELTD